MNFDMSSIASYLDCMIALRKTMYKPEEFTYLCQEDFIKQHGKTFKASGHRPVDFWRNTMKECFANATHLALEDSSMIYCEGYILRIMPIHHAWCVNHEGVVFDPTIKDNVGCEYFGVTFNTEFLANMMFQGTKRYYGLIDNPEQQFPLLRGIYEPEQFLEHLNPKE